MTWRRCVGRWGRRRHCGAAATAALGFCAGSALATHCPRATLFRPFCHPFPQRAPLSDRFAKTFTPAPFHALARSAKWLRRQGKIDAFEFLTALVFAQLSALRLTLNAQIQGLSRPVARQSFHERFTAAAVTYFKAAFTHCLQETLGWEPAQPMAAALRQHFAAVYLLDSTSFDVPASLAAAFPACGGDGSPANVKVLLRYELSSGRLEPQRLLAEGVEVGVHGVLYLYCYTTGARAPRPVACQWNRLLCGHTPPARCLMDLTFWR